MCIFCKIGQHEINGSIIYEDDQVMAFLDLSQVTKGHTLIIPKQHFDNILECDEQTLSHMMIVAQKVGAHLMKVTGAKGLNILNNCNEVAGQTVMHAHIHVIPRYDENDAINIEFNESQPQNLEELANELKLS